MLRKLSLLVAGLSLMLTLTHAEPVQSARVQGEALLALPHSAEASLTTGETRYQSSSTFLSEIFEAPFEFQLLGLNWQEEIPESTQAHMEIRFRDAQGWGDWRELHEDHDAPMNEAGTWTYVITNNADAFQYRAQLSTSDASLTPKLSDISFDYVNGGKEAPLDSLAKVFKKSSSVQEREDWDADESLRYTNERNDKYDSSEEPEFADMEIVGRVEQEDGEYLIWPLEYPANGVQKIIVHHTASEDLDDIDSFAEAVRAVYHYHAVTRGWGDIGYNYLIDPDGTVYEGRAGGSSVVGGHAAGYNTGSVGIALIGNYEDDPIPGAMMKSLTDLIAELSLEHGIDPEGRRKFRGEKMDNILGHRDVGATACPGEHAHDELEDIQKVAAATVDSQVSGDGPYSFEEFTDRKLVLLKPDDSAGNIIRLKNTGTETWNDDTCLMLEPVGEADELVEHDLDRDDCVADLKQSSVKPGSTGTFSFTASSDWSLGGFAQFKLTPLFDGDEEADRSLALSYFVERPSLSFDLKDDNLPSSLEGGEELEVTVKLKNTGNITWKNSGDREVTLKRSGQSKLSNDRNLATLEESSVKPGSTGTFTFDIEAPKINGRHSLYFTLDMDSDLVYSEDTSQLRVRVETEDEEGEDSIEILERSELSDYEPGESRMEWIQVKNTGTTTWSRSGSNALDLSFSADKDVDVDEAKILMSTIKPGMSTRIYFRVTAPDKPGDYEIDIRPRLGSSNLTTSAYEFDLTVEGEASTDDTEEDSGDTIRIKLTPEEEMNTVLFSSSDRFSVYSGGTKQKSYSGNKLVRVTPSGDEFKVSSGGTSVTLDGPLQFESNGGIMKIANFDQRPAWNTQLNDNQFRGIIEVRKIDDELTLINELPMEDYLKGIAEVSDSTHEEKVKTIIVLARSYATYYLTEEEKFPGQPYHLDDSPERSQKYLGYGFEKRSSNVAAAVSETAGQVVTYDGEVVKTPYFSQSDGTNTKSAQEVWGWTHTPYLISVDDHYCEADSFAGHGVGLSGCGAQGMADEGFSYDEIIKYYYTGVELSE